MNNTIALPDASGVFVVEAVPPLYINSSGSVSLEQSQIVEVGQLIAGSIGRSFGKPWSTANWLALRPAYRDRYIIGFSLTL